MTGNSRWGIVILTSVSYVIYWNWWWFILYILGVIYVHPANSGPDILLLLLKAPTNNWAIQAGEWRFTTIQIPEGEFLHPLFLQLSVLQPPNNSLTKVIIVDWRLAFPTKSCLVYYLKNSLFNVTSRYCKILVDYKWYLFSPWSWCATSNIKNYFHRKNNHENY